MDPRLSRLVDLQKSMGEKHRLEREGIGIPGRIETLKKQIADVRETVKEAEETFKVHESQLRSKELELQEVQSKEAKIKGQLHQIKTNKEYQAALQEIDNFQKKRDRIEEEILALMDMVEDERDRVAERREDAKAQEQRLQSTLQGLEQREKEIEEELREAAEHAEEVKKEVDPSLLNRFERIFKSKNGVALTPANGGFCHSCQVKLTPHVIQVVQRGQDFVTCEGCSRYLYWDGELGD